MEIPSPRKSVSGAPVYISRRFGLPEEFGGIILSDFGSAVSGELERNHAAQPKIYRAPEVMLKAPWSYPVDIWNVGAMIWDVFERRHLFNGEDPTGEGYTTRAHLAEVVSLLGPPPRDLLECGVRSKEFFAEDGKLRAARRRFDAVNAGQARRRLTWIVGRWIADVPISHGNSLDMAECFLTGRNKAMFLDFVRGMLAWRPDDRKTARELLEDPWPEHGGDSGLGWVAFYNGERYPRSFLFPKFPY